MTTRQERALKLTHAIERDTKELTELLSSDGTVSADQRLEYVKQAIQTHIKPLLDRKLRHAKGHQGGFRTTLQQVDSFLWRLLEELDSWEIRGIPPESAERLAEMGQRDKERASRAKAMESLLHDYHDFANNPIGAMTAEELDDSDDTDAPLERLNEQYEVLFGK